MEIHQLYTKEAHDACGTNSNLSTTLIKLLEQRFHVLNREVSEDDYAPGFSCLTTEALRTNRRQGKKLDVTHELHRLGSLVRGVVEEQIRRLRKCSVGEGFTQI